MSNKVLKGELMRWAGKVISKREEKFESEWPPKCGGIFHQPQSIELSKKITNKGKEVEYER